LYLSVFLCNIDVYINRIGRELDFNNKNIPKMSSNFPALTYKMVLTYDTKQFGRTDPRDTIGLEINTAQNVDIHSINNVISVDNESRNCKYRSF
jgi:hypothetical protein